MTLFSLQKEPLYILERKVKKLANKNISFLLKSNKLLYRRGRRLFDILPQNWKPRNIRDLITLLFLLRGLENLRAVEILVRRGYLAQAASLVANSIEIFLQTRKVKTDSGAAAKWLNHSADRPCWPITGKKGLCRALNLQKVEGHYKLLCTIKHTQNKTKHLNLISRDGYNALFAAPIWSPDVAIQIVGYNLSSVGDVIKDAGEVIEEVIKPKLYMDWRKELDLLRNTIRLYYFTWRVDLRKVK